MKKNNFSALWKFIESSAHSPTPPLPAENYPAEVPRLQLEPEEIDVLRDGEGDLGLPLLECLVRSSPHLYMLYEFKSRLGRPRSVGPEEDEDGRIQEYEEYRPSKLLMALVAFESSADHPKDYELKISDIITNGHIAISAVGAARALLSQLKRYLSQSFGLTFERMSYFARFTTDEDFLAIKHYHDRNMVKTANRAKDYYDAAYTRYLMGDDVSVDEFVEQTIKRGVPKYRHIYRGQPDTTPRIFVSTRPRHIL